MGPFSIYEIHKTVIIKALFVVLFCICNQQISFYIVFLSTALFQSWLNFSILTTIGWIADAKCLYNNYTLAVKISGRVDGGMLTGKHSL